MFRGKEEGFCTALRLQSCLDDIEGGHEKRGGDGTSDGSDGLLTARDGFTWRTLAEAGASLAQLGALERGGGHGWKCLWLAPAVEPR